jgi:hypothetical protein
MCFGECGLTARTWYTWAGLQSETKRPWQDPPATAGSKSLRYQFHYERRSRREEAKRQRMVERAHRLLIANTQPCPPALSSGETVANLAWPPALQAAIRARLGWPEPPCGGRAHDDGPPNMATIPARYGHIDSGGFMVSAALGSRVLSEEEVRRWLLRVRYEARYRKGRGRVPLKVVAEFVGLHRDTLYEGIKGAPISRCTRSRLSWVIEAIEQGRLRFKRRGQAWNIDYKDKPSPPVPLQTISAPFGSTFGGPD